MSETLFQLNMRVILQERGSRPEEGVVFENGRDSCQLKLVCQRKRHFNVR